MKTYQVLTDITGQSCAIPQQEILRAHATLLMQLLAGQPNPPSQQKGHEGYVPPHGTVVGNMPASEPSIQSLPKEPEDLGPQPPMVPHPHTAFSQPKPAEPPIYYEYSISDPTVSEFRFYKNDTIVHRQRFGTPVTRELIKVGTLDDPNDRKETVTYDANPTVVNS